MIGILTFIFIIGVVVGSFLNVVILRTITGESIIYPNSKCPKCQNALKWYHNIPILSYIFLRGKCAFCKEKISIQYPVVELVSGFIFTIFGFLYFNTIFNTNESIPILTVMFLVSIIASSLFIVISGTDFKEMQVSDIHIYLLICVGVIYSIIIGSFAFYGDYKFGLIKWELLFTPVIYTICAIIIAFIFMEILRRGANLLIRTETFGDGDSYIFAGIAGVITSLFGASDIRYILAILLIIFFFSIILSVIFTIPFYLKNLFISKNWYLIGVISAFIIYCTGYFYLSNKSCFDNIFVLVISTIVLFVLGFLLCNEILKGIKNRTASGTQIPFGPSLCFSGLVALIILPVLLGIV